MLIRNYGREICGDYSLASAREWLETNGIGGFASSTVAGANTRRYHGLLTAATKPPLGRFVLLSRLEETLIVHGHHYDLGVNQYPGVLYPRGFEYLTGFTLDPIPTWTYEVAGLTLTRTLFMPQGDNTVVVSYAVNGDCTLEIRPLIAFRDYHSTTHANSVLDPSVATAEWMATVQPYRDLPALHFGHNADSIEPQGSWYYNFRYEAERERGLDFAEDLYNPFTLRFEGRRTATLVASLEATPVAAAPSLLNRELQRRRVLVPEALTTQPLLASLVRAADAFIADRGSLKTIVAGYHWFGDWGRDAMISLPGLTLVTGRPDVAEGILLAFAASVSDGMLPNRFPDDGEQPEYNTVDATLWFFDAVRALAEHTGDLDFVRTRLYGVLRDIFHWHIRGTRYGIRADHDGLLRAGDRNTQLTWMDARVNDRPVTPRGGKPVEIQALWYNALRILEEFASAFGDDETAAAAREIAIRAKDSFAEKFWNHGAGCLYDIVGEDGPDASIRPNQIFAASLHFPILAADRMAPMLDVAERELLTPVGLRTLSPRDPRYRPRYDGGVAGRDSAYHQGTVWPWLLGPYLSARTKSGGSQADSLLILGNFFKALEHAGLSQIPEIFDAEEPHTPRGCIAQAWSVAELLRAAAEVMQLEPVPVKRTK